MKWLRYAMMTLAVIGLIIPTLVEVVRESQFGELDLLSTEVSDPALNALSLGVAAVLMVLYVLSLIFTFRQTDCGVGGHTGVDAKTNGEAQHQARWSVSVDGESNWLEGAQLLAVYIITGLGFFYLLAGAGGAAQAVLRGLVGA
ncbi:MAG: hypothetical protein AB4911_18585 [Oscillochloridaceae bacterium umkhey_bin13]